MKRLSDDIDTIIRKLLAGVNPWFVEIIINWSTIAGGKFCDRTIPLRVSSIIENRKKVNILHVQAEDAPLSCELMFCQDLIIERINVYLGFKAIDKITSIVHKSVNSDNITYN